MAKKERLKKFREFKFPLPWRAKSVLEEVAKFEAVEDIIPEKQIVGHFKTPHIEVRESIEKDESGESMLRKSAKGTIRVFIYTKNSLGRGMGYIAEIVYDRTKATSSAIRKYIRGIKLNGDGDYYPAPA